MKKRFTLLFILGILATSFLFSQDTPEQKPPPFPCLDSEVRRQFDFWLGEWDVFVGEKQVGESSITMAQGGCAIHESYTTAGNYAGQSINFYDPIAKKWKQSWVGSAGDVGNYEETDSGEGDMQFQTRQLTAKGVIVLRKMTFTYNSKEDTVRQLLEDSTDEGETWKTVFDGLYKRKKAILE